MTEQDDEEEEERITQERRKIRGKQRELQEDFHQVKAQLNNVESDKFQTMRERLNEIFVNVHHPREQQNDALTFKALSMAAKEQSSNMSDSAHRFDFTLLATKIASKYANEEVFPWSKFGQNVSHTINNAPSFGTMLGPISKELKVRKLAVRKEKENMSMNAEKPEDISQDDKDGDEATNERLKILYTMIMEQMPDGNEHQQRTFNLLKLLVDPADPVQTIENFFDYSFLIKEKQVLQDVCSEDGLPMAFGIDQNKLNNSNFGIDKKQMILSINMQDLSEFSKLLYPDYRANGSGETNPLHRSDPLYDAVDAGEQADIIQRTQQAKSDERRKSRLVNSGVNGSPNGNVRSKGITNSRCDVATSSQLSSQKDSHSKYNKSSTIDAFKGRKCLRTEEDDHSPATTSSSTTSSSRQVGNEEKRSRLH